MVVAGIAWVVLTPYCTGLVVATSKRANRLVANHLLIATALGWAAIAALLCGVFAIHGSTGMIVAACAAPFVGLAFWTASARGDDGGEPPPDDPEKPPPSDDRIDWDAFMRDLGDWQRGRSPRDRVPA